MTESLNKKEVMTTSTSGQNIPLLTVSQLTNYIKNCLEATFPFIWLKGEISNLKLQSSGHLYFSLKDAQAQIAAVMFRSDILTMKQMPKEGDQVLVKGSLNVYPPKGNYQLLVREMSLVGLGELLLKLEELKQKLMKMGWFKNEHKKPLPKFPKTIGVVTSPTGAAIQDILHILTRRFSNFHLILNPVKVQGEGAAQEIAQAIAQFNKFNLADVLIVGRGGGSIEDLWAFNEEIVAEAIYKSEIPIISAVGHETDHCIADYVADVRAPTPSAAAEIVIAEKAHQVHHLNHIQHRLQQGISHQLIHYRQKLSHIKRHPLIASPQHLLGLWIQKLDHIKTDIQQILLQDLHRKKLRLEALQRQAHALKPDVQIQHMKQKLLYARKSIDSFITQRLSIKQERLKKLALTLHAIDPKNLLTKGYTILFSEKDKSVITTTRALEKWQKIKLLMADGEAIATVDEINTK